MDVNSYNELREKFPVFLKNIGKEDQVKYADSIIICDSDKCDQYKQLWKSKNIPFIHNINEIDSLIELSKEEFIALIGEKILDSFLSIKYEPSEKKRDMEDDEFDDEE